MRSRMQILCVSALCAVISLLTVSLPAAVPKQASSKKTVLTKKQQSQLNQIAAMVASDKPKKNRIKRRWRKLIRQLAKKNRGQVDVRGLVRQVEQKARARIKKSTQPQANAVKDYTKLKQAMRTELARTRGALKNVKAGKSVSFRPRPVPSPVRSPKVRNPAARFQSSNPPKIMTDERALEEYIKKWEQELQTVGDDAELANIELQNMLQKQQQTMQMMSNSSKRLHDTAMAVIRKMG